MSDANTIGPRERLVLDTIFSFWRSNHSWPTLRRMIVIFLKDGKNFEDEVKLVPRHLYMFDRSNQDSGLVRLTLDGLAHCDGMEPVIQAFLDLHRLAVTKFINDPNGVNTISKRDLRDRLPELSIQDFEAIADLARESLPGGDRPDEAGWNKTIDEGSLIFKDIASLSQWREARFNTHRTLRALEPVHVELLKAIYAYWKKSGIWPEYRRFLVNHLHLGNTYRLLHEIPKSHFWEQVRIPNTPENTFRIELTFDGVAATGIADEDLELVVEATKILVGKFLEDPDRPRVSSEILSERLKCSAGATDRLGYLLQRTHIGANVHSNETPWVVVMQSLILGYSQVITVADLVHKHSGLPKDTWKQDILNIKDQSYWPPGTMVDAPKASDLTKPAKPEQKAAMEKKTWSDRWEKIQEFEDAGKQAKVYLVRDIKNAGAKAVLKEYSLGHPQRKKRVLREIRNQKKLHHAGIAKVLADNLNAVEKKGDKAYLVTEYYPSGSLKAIAASFGNQLELSLKSFAWICDALIYAHEQGVVHRDLHPGNIVFGPNIQQPALIDFGICASKEDFEGDRTTEVGETLGDPDFAPPEYRKGRTDEPDERGDIYSLGKLLYFMLSGGDKAIHERCDDPRLDKKWNDARYSVLYEDFFSRTCAYEPKDRYQTIKDLRKALDQVMGRIAGKTEAPRKEGQFALQFGDTEIPEGPSTGNLPTLSLDFKHTVETLVINVRNISQSPTPTISHLYWCTMPGSGVGLLDGAIVEEPRMRKMGHTLPVPAPTDVNTDGITLHYRLKINIDPLPVGAIETIELPGCFIGDVPNLASIAKIRILSGHAVHDFPFRLVVHGTPGRSISPKYRER
jgi:serine/threonine protein kinase